MDWLLRQARLADDAPPVDIGIEAGRIAAIGPALSVSAAETWDLEGRVVLPGLVDAHTHLDKTFTDIRNQSGTLAEAIDVWREIKQACTPESIRASAQQALRLAISHGVTALRSHVNTEDATDLVTLEVLLDLREQMRELIDLQFVALGYPGGGPDYQAAMEQAFDMGVDLVGGAPALADDPRADIDAAFALAERFGKPIDLHIDETEDPHSLTLEYLAEQTIAHGMQGQVTAGHCCSLAFVDGATAARVIEKVAEAQLNIVTLPSCNLVLMGRGMQPAPRGTTPVKALLAARVNVCAASDNVHDPFNPFGAYDLLHIANLNAHLAHMSGQAEIYQSLRMVTTHPAKVLGLPGDGLVKEGAVADLVVVNSRRVLDTVLSTPPRLATFKAGKLVVRTAVERVWYGG